MHNKKSAFKYTCTPHHGTLSTPLTLLGGQSVSLTPHVMSHEDVNTTNRSISTLRNVSHVSDVFI